MSSQSTSTDHVEVTTETHVMYMMKTNVFTRVSLPNTHCYTGRCNSNALVGICDEEI